MGCVGTYLPIITQSLQSRGLKSQGHHRIHEEIHQVTFIGLVNRLPHIQNRVEGCAWILLRTLF